MPIVDVSGDPAAGSGDLTASLGIIYLFTAATGGSGSLSDPLLVEPSPDPASGTGDTDVLRLVVVRDLFARFEGVGTVGMVGVPEPAFGQGDTAANMVVDTPRPVYPPPWCGTPKFTWGQVLTHGDLPLYLRDTSGPYVPYLVNYTVYWVRPDGYALQVGAAERTPIMADVGVFYATGVTGEAGGQPGLWRIEWTWRRRANDPVERLSYDFRVLDAVLMHAPSDSTPRVRKYGWGPA